MNKVLEYISVLDAAHFLKISRRGAHKKLSVLFDPPNDDKNGVFAYSVIEDGHRKNYYRYDKVVELSKQPRATVYKRTCKFCGKKFKPTNKETCCKDCSKIFDSDGVSKEYDLVALRSLLMVLTSKKLWDIVTTSVILFWVAAIALLLVGCI